MIAVNAQSPTGNPSAMQSPPSMRAFAAARPGREVVQRVVAQLQGRQNIDLFERLADAIKVYLSAVDDLLRHPDDKPTIGLLLCRSKDRIVVEYALRDPRKSIGVAGWETKIVAKLLENLKGSLHSVEELEAKLSREENKQ